MNGFHYSFISDGVLNLDDDIDKYKDFKMVIIVVIMND